METGTPRFRHELVRYLISGCSAVATDLVVYWLLLKPLGISPAKTVSFISATCVAYTLNKFWTFKRTEHSWPEMFKFAALYSYSLIANVAVNKCSLYMIETRVPALQIVEYQISFLLATGTSTIINYIGQKFWVFKHDKPVR
jgi:putative flippase GtrA